MAEFGQGATISYSGTIARVISVSSLNLSSAVTDVTLLSQKTGYREKKFSQLVDHETFEVTLYTNFDGTAQAIDDWLPAHGVETDVVITSPAGGNTITGKAAVVGRSTGDLVSDEVVVGTVTLQFRGGSAVGTITTT